MNNGTWTVVLEEDAETGDLILPFPPDFCVNADWREGDTLKFTVNDDQRCIITNLDWEERHKGEADDEVVES